MWVKPSLCESHEPIHRHSNAWKGSTGLPLCGAGNISAVEPALKGNSTGFGESQSQNQPKQNHILEPKNADSPW